jgi:hypothetical protein
MPWATTTWPSPRRPRVDGTEIPGREAGEAHEINPLVQRVDALLKRHQEQVHAQHAPPAAPAPASPAPPPPAEDDFPVLTEVVDPELALQPAAVSAPAAPADPAQIAALLETAVLDKLLPELERTLDQRLARNISELLEQVLHGLRAELSVSVRRMVRDAVSVAVARELAARAADAGNAPGEAHAGEPSAPAHRPD